MERRPYCAFGGIRMVSCILSFWKLCETVNTARYRQEKTNLNYVLIEKGPERATRHERWFFSMTALHDTQRYLTETPFIQMAGNSFPTSCIHWTWLLLNSTCFQRGLTHPLSNISIIIAISKNSLMNGPPQMMHSFSGKASTTCQIDGRE